MTRTRLALVAVALIAALLRVRPFFDLDWWWHLSMGRAVLAHGARVVPEPVAFQGPAVYVDPEWLFDVLAVGLQTAGGTGLATAFVAACAAVSALLVAAVARQAGADEGGAVVVAALAAAGSNVRFQARPEAVELVFLPIALWLALRVRRHEGRWPAFAALHALLLVWSQLHTSVIVVPFVVGALIVLPWPGAPRLRPAEIAATVALLIYPLLGAWGPRIVEQVLLHSDGDATRYIADMVGLRPRDLLPPSTVEVAVAEALVAIGLWGAFRRREVPWAPLALAVLGVLMVHTAHRFVAEWSILAAPLAATALRRTPPVATLGAVAGWALLLSSQVPRLGFGVDTSMVPLPLADALEARGISGPVFADYGDGGYLGWRLAPRVRLFIDGRTPTHFDADELYAYRRAMRDVDVFERLAVAYDVRTAAIRRDRWLCRGLAASDRWSATWVGDDRVIFERDAGGTGEETEPCLPPEPAVLPPPGGADAVWPDTADAAAVRHRAEVLLDLYGHDADPRIRLRLAEACRALGDADCAASQAFRAVVDGVPGADEVLTSVLEEASERHRARARAWLRGAWAGEL